MGMEPHLDAYMHFKDFLSKYPNNGQIGFYDRYVESLFAYLKYKYRYAPSMSAIEIYSKRSYFTPDEVRDILRLYEEKIEVNLNKKLMEAIRKCL
jgi:hypothetical protein